MKKLLVKIGAVAVLILAIIIALSLAIAGVLIIIHLPNYNIKKAVPLSIGLIVVAVIILLSGLSIFVSLYEVEEIEEKLEEKAPTPPIKIDRLG
jgi:ABC-type sulfate transport system permease component